MSKKWTIQVVYNATQATQQWGVNSLAEVRAALLALRAAGALGEYGVRVLLSGGAKPLEFSCQPPPPVAAPAPTGRSPLLDLVAIYKGLCHNGLPLIQEHRLISKGTLLFTHSPAGSPESNFDQEPAVIYFGDAVTGCLGHSHSSAELVRPLTPGTALFLSPPPL